MTRPAALVALLAGVGLLLGGAAQVRAQAAGLERLRATLPAEAVDRLDRVVAEAERDGVPSVLLVDKALEGAAKGARPEQVVRTVEAYAAELRAALRLVGEGTAPHALAAAAEAVRRGAAGVSVRSLASGSPPDLTMRLVTLGDLVADGVPSAAAAGLIETAAERGYRGDRLLSLPGAVRRELRAGATPAEAAAAVRRALEEGGGPPGGAA